MRRQLLVLLALIALVGCGESPSNQSGVAVDILALNPHPYLIDHDRVCVITRDGQEITRFNLYPDTGTGLAISNLYQLPDPDQLVLIDGNGTWYFIDKRTGVVLEEEWNWGKETPEDFVGTFRYVQHERGYFLIGRNDSSEPDIYLVKDPNTQ